MKELWNNSFFIRGLIVCLVAMFVGIFVISYDEALEIWDKLGAATIIAVMIATYGVIKQIETANKLQRKEIAKEIYGLSYALAGEINGLIFRCQHMKYIDFFESEYQKALNYEEENRPFQIGSFYANGAYTIVFDGNVDKIGLLGELAGEVSSLYSHIKGTIETANGIASGLYKNEKQSEIAKSMVDALLGLCEVGSKLSLKLREHADAALYTFHS